MIKVIKETKTGKTFEYQGVQFSANIYGKILWASDWGKLLEMVDNGLLKSETYTDIFIDDTKAETDQAPQVIVTDRKTSAGDHLPSGTTISGTFSIDGSEDLLHLDNAEVYYTDKINKFLFPSVHANENDQLCVEAMVITLLEEKVKTYGETIEAETAKAIETYERLVDLQKDGVIDDAQGMAKHDYDMRIFVAERVIGNLDAYFSGLLAESEEV